ncbi:hypothetical protein FS749_005863 [Ceratobasidium sp. UAMH 11750]|nr:hypothetical protein FS749_005863 [Ceratobasidium sp. UAMH 11750]
MNSLTEGPYQLRYVAPDETIQAVDGLYATRVDGIGNAITVGPRVSSLLEAENWWFAKATGGRYWYILGPGPATELADRGRARPGFGHGVVKQGTPIVLAVELGEYELKPLGDNEYTIGPAPRKPNSEPSGVDYVISASSKGTLEIREVMTHEDGQPVIPRWLLQKVE